MPSNDPYGRNGPTLDQLLQNCSRIASQKDSSNKNSQKSKDKNPSSIKTRAPSPSISQNRHAKSNPLLEIQNSPTIKDPYSIFEDDDDTVTHKKTQVHNEEQKGSVARVTDDDDDDSDKESVFSYIDNVDDDDEDENGSHSKDENENSKTNFEKDFAYIRKITIRNGKKFKRFFYVKTLSLTEKSSTFISVVNADKNGGKYQFNNIVISIKSNDKISFDKAVEVISKWRVMVKKITFANKNEFAQLIPMKNEIIEMPRQSLANKKEVHVFFNTIKCEIIIMMADPVKSSKVFREFEAFCLSQIDATKELRVQNDAEYELLTRCLKIGEFKRKNNLESIQFDFRKQNPSGGGKVFFKGKRSQLNNVNFNKLQQIFTITEDHFMIKSACENESSTSVLSFIKNRLEKFKRDLIKEHFVYLEFRIEERDKSDGFLDLKIIGFDQFEIEKIKHDLVNDFLKRAASKVIQLKIRDVNDMSRVEKLVKDFKTSINSTNDIASENGDDADDSTSSKFKFFVDTEIIFNAKLKKIFLNSTDPDELEEMTNDLQEKIDGSKKWIECKRYSSFIFDCLIRDKCIDRQLKPKFKDTRFVVNYNQHLIRLNGLKDQVENASKELDTLCSNISERIVTTNVQVKKTELAYLESRKLDIATLEKNTNSFINLNPFVRYSFLQLNNNVNIELIHGDMTKLNVNAYINPANKDLKHMGGLAKAISRAAGKQIDQECNTYIADRGQMMDGDVFVSSAGFLGFLSNSIVVHAVGPSWRGGMNREELNLTNAVRRSLESIDLKFSNSSSSVSVAIPPISTGIFNYPIDQATKIITETVIDYLQTKLNSKIKNIKFISNEEVTVKEWVKVLNDVSVNKSLQLDSVLITSTANAKWYWKDDQGFWKLYMPKYLNFIQSNFERRNFLFDLNIIESGGNSYKIDLNNMTQTNQATGYIHQITNVGPMTQRAQWFWRDDYKNHSPYSLLHSDLIETAYLNGQTYAELKIKRLDNDQDDTYRIIFCQRDASAKMTASKIDENAVAIQSNMRTGYNKRVVYRDSLLESAKVIEVEPPLLGPIIQIYISVSFQNQIKIVETKLKSMIQEGYVKERVSYLDLSNEKIEELQKEYDAIIVKDSDYLIITAIKEKAIQLKSVLLEMAVEGSKFTYPKDWSPMESSCNFKIDQVDMNSQEFTQIKNHFKQTLPNATISKIERIQNKWLWKLYAKSVSLLKEKSNDENERYLFHGTRANE